MAGTTTEATFHPSASVDGPPGYRERAGETVTVVEEVPGEQDPDADDDAVATIYRIRFDDGTETEAFADELEPTDGDATTSD